MRMFVGFFTKIMRPFVIMILSVWCLRELFLAVVFIVLWNKDEASCLRATFGDAELFFALMGSSKETIQYKKVLGCCWRVS